MGGMPEPSDIEGTEGEMGIDQAAEEAGMEEGPEGGAPEGGMEMLSEALLNRKLNEVDKRRKTIQEDSMERSRRIMERLVKRVKDKSGETNNSLTNIPLSNKAFFVNEELDAMSKHLEKYLKEHEQKDIY